MAVSPFSICMRPSNADGTFVLANWERVLFLHFASAPELVRRWVPAPFELELHQGRACLSLAAVTMTSFRPSHLLSPGWLLRPIGRQQFLNFRTYVRYLDEPGVLFLWGWLSRPLPLRLPSGAFGLPYSFARLDYYHRPEHGVLRGAVTDEKNPSLRFAYRAKGGLDSGPTINGSLAEFAMERCTGYFCRRHRARISRGADLVDTAPGFTPCIFHGRHPRWRQVPLDAVIEEANLVTSKFPWFREASFAEANFGMGFDDVRLGLARRLLSGPCVQHSRRKVLAAFYDLP